MTESGDGAPVVPFSSSEKYWGVARDALPEGRVEVDDGELSPMKRRTLVFDGSWRR